MFVNDRWCNSGHITVKEQLCCRDFELLAVSMRPYYLPREFSHVIVIARYRPSFLSLEILIMLVHPPFCPHSASMSTATQYVNCFIVTQ